MGVEIERKFLVVGEPWLGTVGVPMEQAYIASEAGRTVRVRRAGDVGTLTVKGPTRGVTRAEFEFEIPAALVGEMVDALAPPDRVSKVRYELPVGDHVYEVDVFGGKNAGLVVAEVELGAEEEAFTRPPWLGEEVTDDPRYLNVNLARRPWSCWERP